MSASDYPQIWEDTSGAVIVLAQVTLVEPVSDESEEYAAFGVYLTGGFRSIRADTDWPDGKLVAVRTANQKRDDLLAALRAHLAGRSAA